MKSKKAKKASCSPIMISERILTMCPTSLQGKEPEDRAEEVAMSAKKSRVRPKMVHCQFMSSVYSLCVQRLRPEPSPEPEEKEPERDEDGEEEEAPVKSWSKPNVCCWPLLSDYSPHMQQPKVSKNSDEYGSSKQGTSCKVSASTTLGYD
jgi:hypothetical protein